MGYGVVDPYGDSPAENWALRLFHLDNPRLAEIAKRLLGGDAVDADDDDLQIIWKGGPRALLVIRDAKPAPYYAEIIVRPLTRAELLQVRRTDQRGLADPVPTVWTSRRSDTQRTWELFNARIESVVVKRA